MGRRGEANRYAGCLCSYNSAANPKLRRDTALSAQRSLVHGTCSLSSKWHRAGAGVEDHASAPGRAGVDPATVYEADFENGYGRHVERE